MKKIIIGLLINMNMCTLYAQEMPWIIREQDEKLNLIITFGDNEKIKNLMPGWPYYIIDSMEKIVLENLKCAQNGLASMKWDMPNCYMTKILKSKISKYTELDNFIKEFKSKSDINKLFKK